MPPANQQRLAKVMAQRGLCAKREADRLIEAGLVRVDGEVAPPSGLFIRPDAVIEILPEGRRELAGQLTIMLHKPAGAVSNLPAPGQQEALELIVWESCAAPGEAWTQQAWATVKDRLDTFHVAGRLDYESTGLLILTQDGLVARALTGEAHDVEKEYIVHTVSLEAEAVSDEQLAALRRPIRDEGETLRAVRVDKLDRNKLRFVLCEGRKRQIRRMCAAVGLDVAGLKRVRIGMLPLGDLPRGQWRFLREDDLRRLTQQPPQPYRRGRGGKK